MFYNPEKFFLLKERKKIFYVEMGMRGGGRLYRWCEIIRRFSTMKIYMTNVGLLIKCDSLNAAEKEQLDIVVEKYQAEGNFSFETIDEKYRVTGPAAALYEVLYRLSNVCDIELI